MFRTFTFTSFFFLYNKLSCMGFVIIKIIRVKTYVKCPSSSPSPSSTKLISVLVVNPEIGQSNKS